MKSHILCILLMFTPFLCNAALIDHGKYVEDDIRNVYWLKLTETAGLSYNEVNSLLSSGESLHGWNFATWNEARDLYKFNFGLDLEGADFSPRPSELAKIAMLNSYMGDLMTTRGEPNEYSGSTAIVSDRSAIETYYYNYGANMRDTTGLRVLPDKVRPYLASVLIRSDAPVVPIPPSVFLFGSGVLGLVGVARRK